MASSQNQIFSVNPYEDHPRLTQLEADVLWEYAKLNQHVKDVRHCHTLILDCTIASYDGSVPKTERVYRRSWSSRLAL